MTQKAGLILRRLDIELLHLVAQLAHADAEQAGGPGAVELGLLQGAADDVAFDLFQVFGQVARQDGGAECRRFGSGRAVCVISTMNLSKSVAFSPVQNGARCTAIGQRHRPLNKL